MASNFYKKTENNWNSPFEKSNWLQKDRVRNAKVMIIGIGALGNEVVKNLTLLNIGYLFLVDDDIVEYPNLSRSILFRETDIGKAKVKVAADRIKEINPQVSVQTIYGDVSVVLGFGVLRKMDVIISCVDNRATRLFLNRICYKFGKAWIDGGIGELGGQIAVYKLGYNCYECGLTSQDLKFISERISCPSVAVAKEKNDSIITTPIYASIIGALQSQEALKLIFEEKDQKNSMVFRSFYFTGHTNEVLQRKYLKKKPHCISHNLLDNIITSKLTCQMTIAEAISVLEELLGVTGPEIILTNQLILEITTYESNKVYEVVIPYPHLTNEKIKQYQTLPNEALIITQKAQKLDDHFKKIELTLLECGIPPLHIIEVLTDKGRVYVELSADEAYIDFK